MDHTRLAWLMDKAQTNKSFANRSMLNADKSDSVIALEKPFDVSCHHGYHPVLEKVQ